MDSQNYIRVSSYITIFTFEWTSFISLMSLKSKNRLQILKKGPMTKNCLRTTNFFDDSLLFIWFTFTLFKGN